MNVSKTRRTLDDIIRFTSSVGENTIFTGVLSTSDNIAVRGTIIGNSKINGIVVIKQKGKWLGNITANSLIINGHIEGTITASVKIEIQRNATVIGDLNCPQIAIECGAIHQGKIHMHKQTKITKFNEKRQT